MFGCYNHALFLDTVTVPSLLASTLLIHCRAILCALPNVFDLFILRNIALNELRILPFVRLLLRAVWKLLDNCLIDCNIT